MLAKRGIMFLEKITKYAGKDPRWIILDEEETSSDYGVLPYERKISDLINNGVINLDKPPGPTSHEVVAWIKKMFGLKKAGHGGTLEPVLPLKIFKVGRRAGGSQGNWCAPRCS